MNVALVCPSAPPKSPHGGHWIRSVLRLTSMSCSGRTRTSTPMPPRNLPAPPLSGRNAWLVKQWIIQLLQLDRRILYVPLAHRHGRRRAILERPAAPAPADDVLADRSP